MSFFRRLFRREKRKRSTTNADPATSQLREANLEKAWIGGWNSTRRAIPSTEETCDNSTQIPHRASALHFDECFLGTNRTMCVISNEEQRPKTVTALQPAVGTRQNATCALPPLPTIPGALLSFPRFQEYVCTFLRDEIVPFGQTSNRQSPDSQRESSVIEPLTPNETPVTAEGGVLSSAHMSLTPSLVNSVVPSLVYSECSPSADSTHSFSAGTSCTSSSSHSFFSSSSFSSYLSRRHAKEHANAPHPPRPPTEKTSDRQRKKKYGKSSRYAPATGTSENVDMLPTIQHANKYAGSRSMSGPYPCITSSRQPDKMRSLSSAINNGDYYP